MKGKITKIDPTKESKNRDTVFTRVYFSLENGEFAWTDLVPSFRNFARWKNLLKTGNELDNLERMKDGRVNADSHPVLIREPQNYEVEIVEVVDTRSLF